MTAGLPDDLAEIRKWVQTAIRATWDLHVARQKKAMVRARNRLIETVENPPDVSPELQMELILASDYYQREAPGRVEGVPGKHAVDAVRQTCLRALYLVHLGARRALKAQVESWRGFPPKHRPAKYDDWKDMLSLACDALADLSLPAKTDSRKALDKVYEKFPVALWAPSPQRLPMEIPHPDGELAALVDKIVHRVWHERLRRQGGRERESDPTPVDPDDARAERNARQPATTPANSHQRRAKKRAPGRPRKTDPEADAQIVERWEATKHLYRTYEEFAKNQPGNLTGEGVKRIIDRDRHRKREK